MKKFLVFLLGFLCLVVFPGCGGGGGKDNSNNGTHFNVTVYDSGAGFQSAGQTNFVLLYTKDGTYYLESSRAIRSSEIKSNSRASFSSVLGTPRRVGSSGTGVYEVRIAQGAAGTWKSSDYYDRWKVNGNIYVLGYGPPGSNYPGWSVWDLLAVSHVCGLSGYNMTINTYLMYTNSSYSTLSMSKPSDISEDIVLEKMAQITAKY